jgi:hypothetical protein
MTDRSGSWDRRTFLRTLGLSAAVAVVRPTRAAEPGAAHGGGPGSRGHIGGPRPGEAGGGGGVIPAPVGGSDEPYPIPWLDKNGSHNEPAGPKNEPSSIYHFKGRVARAADFTGSGVDGKGERLLFGTQTTDNSYMQGECWTSHRRARTGAWTHL